MEYHPFLYDGVKYILGDNGCVYHNKNSDILGFLDDNDKPYIEWLLGEEKKHNKKKKDDTGFIKINNPTKSNVNNGLKNEENVINEFNNNPEYRKNSCLRLNIPSEGIRACKVVKSNGFINKYTQRWSEFKKGTGESSPSPKTDIAIVNIDTNIIICKISLKSGDGRPTSCDYYELNALFNSVIESKSEYLNNEILRETISKILNIIKSVGKQISFKTKTEIDKLYNTNPSQLPPEIYEWYSNYLNSKKELDRLWLEIHGNHIEFVRDVFHECLWGNHKFGNNCGCADYLLITKTSKTIEIDNIIKLNSLEGELLNYCDKCIKKNMKPLAIKSSRPNKDSPYKLWVRFL